MINSKDISVVVQGAIDRKNTPKCLKSIRKFLPKAEIILSTWKNSDIEGLDYDILVLNQDPGGYKHDFALINNKSSINNFNRQLISTCAGVLKSDRKYCLKLRSDLILKNSKFLNYWNGFELQNNKYKLFSHRVICSSIYSRENSCCITGNGLPTPFHPSDFWFFGVTEDLKKYFCSSSLQTLVEASNWSFKYPNRLPYSSMLWRYAPEQCFCVNWVKKYYPDLQFEDWSDWDPHNIELSNNILYNNFIFLDYEQSGIYSKKHSWAIKNKDRIQGLITYRHFQEQYKNYCDKTYHIDNIKTDYVGKLYKHFNYVTKPFFYINKWFSEVCSVVYYAFITILKGWRQK